MTDRVDLVTPETSTKIDATVSGSRVQVSAQTLAESTGWTVKPEGFCLGELCVPARGAIDSDGNVDLVAFADLTGRPIITDLDEGALSLGAPFESRGSDLNTLQAPDFSLPDLTGKLHSLSDYSGKKILLAAYASW